MKSIEGMVRNALSALDVEFSIATQAFASYELPHGVISGVGWFDVDDAHLNQHRCFHVSLKGASIQFSL